ncbi:hypothetical protein K438DRAFT_2024052 [Mycena galopus ATCC 62051]|nr:hypothetical protein K438DRAFT_2024052 [Mycena galopus ATCC 62051]
MSIAIGAILSLAVRPRRPLPIRCTCTHCTTQNRFRPSQRPAPPSSTVLLLATHAQRSLALRSLTPLPAHLVRFAHPKLFLPPALTAQCLRLRLEPRRTAASSPYYAFHTCPLHVVRNPHAQPIPRYFPDTRTIRTLFAARFPPRYLLPGPQITAHSPHPSIVLDSF